MKDEGGFDVVVADVLVRVLVDKVLVLEDEIAQTPYFDWHVEPHSTEVFPQRPFAEQHDPKVLPLQVRPVKPPPHFPSVETLLSQMPNSSWQLRIGEHCAVSEPLRSISIAAS